MAEKIERMWCRQCDDWQRFTSARANHLLHFFLSLVTLGLWLFVWFFMLFWADWRCSECGSAQKGRPPKAKRPEQKPKEQAAPLSFTPPRPSVLKEIARAEWDEKYGKKG